MKPVNSANDTVEWILSNEGNSFEAMRILLTYIYRKPTSSVLVKRLRMYIYGILENWLVKHYY